jgi:hypothetical protein
MAKTGSNSKLRFHFAKNSMFSRRVNMRQRAGLNCNWYKIMQNVRFQATLARKVAHKHLTIRDFAAGFHMATYGVVSCTLYY